MKKNSNINYNEIGSKGIHNLLSVNKQFVRKNTVLFDQNQETSGIYYILEGNVKISKIYKKEKERILKVATNGDIIGIEAFIKGLYHSATATVLEDSTICYLSKKELDEIIRQNPYICFELLSKLYKYLLYSEKRIFLISINIVEEQLKEIIFELNNYEKTKQVIKNTNSQDNNAQTSNLEIPNSEKHEHRRQSQKINYFQLKIQQMFC